MVQKTLKSFRRGHKFFRIYEYFTNIKKLQKPFVDSINLLQVSENFKYHL